MSCQPRVLTYFHNYRNDSAVPGATYRGESAYLVSELGEAMEFKLGAAVRISKSNSTEFEFPY